MLLEKILSKLTPKVIMYYNDGTGFLDPMSTGRIINRMMSGSSLSGIGTSHLSSGEIYANICAEREREQESLCKEIKALSQMTPSTSLFGNVNNAIMHEKLDQSGTSLDYHHHNNFNTKPSPEGDEGFGGYMNLNIASTPKFKIDMNKNVTEYGLSMQQLSNYKQDSNWLTRSGTKQEENLAQGLLNNFNYSDNFSPKKIKNNNLLGWLDK